jgi:hypothetical protein
MHRRDFAKALSAIPLLAADVGRASARPVASAFTEIVRAQSGQHLDAADMERIAKDFEDYVPLLEELRKFPLTNADEPYWNT